MSCQESNKVVYILQTKLFTYDIANEVVYMLQISPIDFDSTVKLGKGQLILRCLFGVFNSPKKRTSTLVVKSIVLFIFWEN